MTRRLVVRPQAESEILQAHHWYESRRPGLGHAFGVAIDQCMAAIADRPLAHPRVRGDMRRGLVRRFP